MRFDLERFELIVEPREYYKNGDRVKCILIIELNGRVKCKQVFVTAIGEMFARFDKHRSDRYSTRNYFMSIPIDFRSLVKSDVLTTGSYRLPFEFYLTSAYLPTFIVKDGHIRYYIESIIDQGLLHSEIKNARADFKVISELNILAYHPNPIGSTKEVLIRLFGIKVGVVRLSVNLDKDILTQGEQVFMSYHLDNRSTKSIRFLPKLVQKSTFRDKSGRIVERYKLMAVNHSEVCPEYNSRSDVMSISVPYDAHSSIDTQIFQINYSFKLLVDISGNGSQYFDSLSVIIN